jgi:predicted ATP-grasp superfamily ATP-dependent carboligase
MAPDVSLTSEADEPPLEAVIAAFAHSGMGGMIACSYRIVALDLEQTGDVQAAGATPDDADT